MSGFHADGKYYDVTASDGVEIKRAAAQLTEVGIEGGLRESQRIWASVFAADYVNHGELGDGVRNKQFWRRIDCRANHVPLSHILGYRDFYDHRFIVTPDVLDPRPDTETLVAECLSFPFARVLDLGTGSGCILLSLLAARGAATGLGVDYSQAALDVAAHNVENLDLQARASLCQSDWFSSVTGTFDLIVSNPPYIAADEMAELQAEVQGYEPHMALTDGADGLTCYRTIIADHDPFLDHGGWLAVEIGPTQGEAVSKLMDSAGLTQVRVIPDLDGRDRVVLGQKVAQIDRS